MPLNPPPPHRIFAAVDTLFDPANMRVYGAAASLTPLQVSGPEKLREKQVGMLFLERKKGIIPLQVRAAFSPEKLHEN